MDQSIHPATLRSAAADEHMPDQQHATVTRDRILDVAEHLFSIDGLAATSMRDIAQQANLTAPSLYNHFEGKDALYEAVLERSILPLVQMVRSIERCRPEPDIVDDIVCQVMGHFAQCPNLPRLIHHEAITGGAFLKKMARRWKRPLLERTTHEFRQNADSRLAEEDLPNVVAAWSHLMLGYFALAPLLREVWGEDPLSREQIDRHTRFLRDLVKRIHGHPG